jgi:CheY-like chemotaxis protein
MGILLEAQGHEVLLAEDGQQALDQAIAHRPDVMLLDINMPKMTGIEACRRLKAHPSTAPIAIIIITGLGKRADRINGVAAGADDFLTKPIDREELFLRIRNALHRKHLYDELEKKYTELKAEVELRESLTSMIDADTDAVSALLRPQAQRRQIPDGIADSGGGVPKVAALGVRFDAGTEAKDRKDGAELLERRQGIVNIYLEALQKEPENPEVLNNLAWLLATADNPDASTIERALAMAEKAHALTNGQHAGVLDTLGAAHAQGGRFDKALEAARRGLKLARQSADRPGRRPGAAD